MTPLAYRGNALTWTNVRRLASYGSHTFSYGADGIRYKKDSTTYTLSGSTILKETNGTRTITYFYGVGGVVGFQYNGINYYYQKNLQGDIIAIYDANGTKQAEYVYDAWGKVLSVTNCTTANIGTLNPFRYRSYYYDVETNLYYLETRYYDPETGRFINADGLDYLGEGEELSNYNLFAYCGNNPVMGYDPKGTIFGTLIGAVVGGIFGSFTALIEGKQGKEFWASVADGAVSGAIAGLAADIIAVTGGTGAVVVAVYAGAGAIGSLAGSLTSSAITGEQLTLGEAVSSIIWGGIFGALGGAMTGSVSSMMENASRQINKKALTGLAAVGCAIKKALKNELKEIMGLLLEEVLSNFTSWYAQEYIEYVFEGT